MHSLRYERNSSKSSTIAWYCSGESTGKQIVFLPLEDIFMTISSQVSQVILMHSSIIGSLSKNQLNQAYTLIDFVAIFTDLLTQHFYCMIISVNIIYRVFNVPHHIVPGKLGKFKERFMSKT
jgi:hypothetical protein